MNGDSELIVMTASGAPVWRIGAPFVVLASMVCVVILICNLWVMPASMRALRALITQVRTDVISQVLQPGRFSSTRAGPDLPYPRPLADRRSAWPPRA